MENAENIAKLTEIVTNQQTNLQELNLSSKEAASGITQLSNKHKQGNEIINKGINDMATRIHQGKNASHDQYDHL